MASGKTLSAPRPTRVHEEQREERGGEGKELLREPEAGRAVEGHQLHVAHEEHDDVAAAARDGVASVLNQPGKHDRVAGGGHVNRAAFNCQTAN